MTTVRPTGAGDGGAGAGSATPEKALNESLEDASVLLWFATREGKKVDDAILQDIVSAQSMLRQGSHSPEVEGRFWAAFRELAAVVRPATVDSILATYSYPFGHNGDSGKRRWVDAAATKKKYSIAAVVALAFLIIVQIYWFIGTTWRSDLETNRAELDRIAGNLREMSLAVQVTNDLAERKNRQMDRFNAEQLEAAVINGSNNAQAIVEEQLSVLQEMQGRAVLDAKNVILRGKRIQEMLYGNSSMLNFWDFVTDVVSWLKGEDAVGLGPINSNMLGSVKDKSELIFEGVDYKIAPETLFVTARSFETQHLNVEHALVNSKSMLAILSQYFLPLLYGLLGALAYILRTLSKEIQNVTFTRGSEIRYSLRWPLGMLGGVTVGLFFDPSHFSGLAVITPLGLAFLAGYGVELLFTGLDRMVSAFTGESAERPKAA